MLVINLNKPPLPNSFSFAATHIVSLVEVNRAGDGSEAFITIMAVRMQGRCHTGITMEKTVKWRQMLERAQRPRPLKVRGVKSGQLLPQAR